MNQHVRAAITIDYSASAELATDELRQRVHDDIARRLDTDTYDAAAELTALRIEVDRIDEEAAIYGTDTDQGDGIGRYYELQQLASDCMESNQTAAYHRAAANAADRAADPTKTRPGSPAVGYALDEEARHLLSALCVYAPANASLTTAERLLVAAMIAARANGEELAVPQLATEELPDNHCQSDDDAVPFDVDSEGMNSKRADWAGTALAAFQDVTGTDDGDAISDLVADLCHLCDREGATYGHSALKQIKRGLRAYESEITDTDPDEEEIEEAA